MALTLEQINTAAIACNTNSNHEAAIIGAIARRLRTNPHRSPTHIELSAEIIRYWSGRDEYGAKTLPNVVISNEVPPIWHHSSPAHLDAALGVFAKALKQTA